MLWVVYGYLYFYKEKWRADIEEREVDNDGKPVAGAEIELKIGDRSYKTITTDSQGRFTMTKFDDCNSYTVHMVNVPDGYNFEGANDFKFYIASPNYNRIYSESDNLNVLEYVTLEAGNNDDEASSTINDDEMTIIMVDKKIAHMVSSGGTGTIITVVIAVVLGCITGICIYLGKKKSKEDKNVNKTE